MLKLTGIPTMSIEITESSGNVFQDLGFSSEEATILQMRSELMIDLRKHIQTNQLTQQEASKIFGVSQSRISDLVRGKWEKFSLETLITFVIKSGMSVSIKCAA